MDIEKLDINAVCFGILCNFTPVCGEERAKEAVELVRTLQAENEKLRADLEQVKRERDELERFLGELEGAVYTGYFHLRPMIEKWRGQKED